VARDPINTTDWNAVAARAQAFQALHLAGLSEKRVTEKARFLMVLGLSRAEAAGLLGSSDDSLRIMFAREAKKDIGAMPAKPAMETE
jgi:hypothetical protein